MKVNNNLNQLHCVLVTREYIVSRKPDVILSDRCFQSHNDTHVRPCVHAHTQKKFYREESFTRGKSCLMNNAVIYAQQNCRNPSSIFVHLSCLLLICRDKSEVCVKYCPAPFSLNGNKTQQVTPYHNNLQPPKLKCRLIVEERLFCMASI